MQYEILIKRDRKVIERHQRDDYETAMNLLDILEETMADTYSIEFKDLLVHGR